MSIEFIGCDPALGFDRPNGRLRIYLMWWRFTLAAHLSHVVEVHPVSFSAYVDWIREHNEFAHRANRIFGGQNQVIVERAKSYEQARQLLFDCAKQSYGHHPAGERVRKTVEGLGRLLERLRADEQTDLVVDHIRLVERVRAELLELAAGKRRPA